MGGGGASHTVDELPHRCIRVRIAGSGWWRGVGHGTRQGDGRERAIGGAVGAGVRRRVWPQKQEAGDVKRLTGRGSRVEGLTNHAGHAPACLIEGFTATCI